MTDKKRLEKAPLPISAAIPALQPKPVEAERQFSPMLQGTGTNKLAQISTRTTLPDVDAITGRATITDGNFKVFIEKYNDLENGLKVSTHKLLDMCTIALTKQNNYGTTGEINTSVCIPLDEYMRLCGIPDTKPSKDKARRKIKADLETLYSVSLEWQERSGKQTKDYVKMRVITSQGIKRGNILVGFSPEMAQYLTRAYIMQYPMELLRVDERNPSSYHIGRKLLLHNSITNNQKKGTANIIGVKALLSVCPDIPTYEQVMSTSRHLTNKIIVPFEKALDALENLIAWEYCNTKGAALKETQLKDMEYSTFIELYIKFNVLGATGGTLRIEASNSKAGEAK